MQEFGSITVLSSGLHADQDKQIEQSYRKYFKNGKYETIETVSMMRTTYAIPMPYVHAKITTKRARKMNAYQI